MSGKGGERKGGGRFILDSIDAWCFSEFFMDPNIEFFASAVMVLFDWAGMERGESIPAESCMVVPSPMRDDRG